MPDKNLQDIELRLLLEAIYLRYNYDFRNYSLASLRRRTTAILSAHQFHSITALQERILHDPSFFSTMLDYLTIPTTEMFRDPDYYRAFRTKVVPDLKTYPSLKLWIAGCSTGEEVYSFAILLAEEGLLDRSLIYATDINPANLRKAQEGIYRLDHLKKYETSYQRSGGTASLEHYGVLRGGLIALSPSLRENVVFADHSLATDSVFSEVQAISCRNVLIYFNRELQDRAIGLFHGALCRHGFLGIGEKESLRFSVHQDGFESWDQETRIYRKR